jgi:predicted alpha-1,2-mannosidase
MPPEFDDSYYGFTIHEIREMQIVNMGNYAHGNQPIQHMIYLYNYAGQPWKTQQRIREVLTKLYSPTPDGYPGDEDNGQTSAWYVFSSLGFYPVTPGSDQYVIGSPLFDKATLQLQNGNKFQIIAKDNSEENFYIESASLDGQDWNKTYLNYEYLMQGGTLQLEMTNTPNKERAVNKAAVPFSLSPDKK